MRSLRLATAVALLATAAFTGLAATGSADASPRPHQALRLASMHAAPAHAAPRPATAHPLRVADPAAYARQKAAANAVADARQHAASSAPLAPTTSRSFAGIRDSSSAPSDSTGAIGTTRYIELVNSGYAIFNRTADTPINTGTLLDLMGSTDGFGFDNIFDPR